MDQQPAPYAAFKAEVLKGRSVGEVLFWAVTIAAAFLIGLTVGDEADGRMFPSGPPAAIAVQEVAVWAPYERLESSTEQVPAFRCGKGLTTLELAIGSTIHQDGSTFTLTQTRHDILDRQISVNLKIQLSQALTVPVVILDTAAHHQRPDIYGQTAFEANVGPGSTLDHTFMTEAYTSNYFNVGINAVTVCLGKPV